MRFYLLTLALLMLNITFAQPKQQYKKVFSFVNENDAYLFRNKDGYYTNGIFLTYSIASIKNNQKNIQHFELGQTMYTTGNRNAVVNGFEKIDRPFCGYLYAKYAKDKFISINEIVTINATLGVTGKWSLAQQLQQNYHKLINVIPYPYWETQIHNAIGINAGLSYKNILLTIGNTAKIIATIDGNAGSFFTNAKAGAYFCVGAFENNDRTALFNSNISSKQQTTKRNYELMFYFNPQMTAQAYNATTQGTLFYKTGNALVSKPQTLVYKQTLGFLVSKARYSAKAEFVYTTKEASSQLRNQSYGGIHLGYRFN